MYPSATPFRPALIRPQTNLIPDPCDPLDVTYNPNKVPGRARVGQQPRRTINIRRRQARRRVGLFQAKSGIPITFLEKSTDRSTYMDITPGISWQDCKAQPAQLTFSTSAEQLAQEEEQQALAIDQQAQEEEHPAPNDEQQAQDQLAQEAEQHALEVEHHAQAGSVPSSPVKLYLGPCRLIKLSFEIRNWGITPNYAVNGYWEFMRIQFKKELKSARTTETNKKQQRSELVNYPLQWNGPELDQQGVLSAREHNSSQYEISSELAGQIELNQTGLLDHE
ncbi:hypothetical protein F511_27873 [Dorcoceras hygrometricum]|uniref:Uncharacterized protein n=1 Tax=Dorcoceras hygrometricum TaxID=472368 RepID=A0A2Z7AXY3_9LAMI|nr:hypothetical protein F511_27873 [Dorcoceras hygrometricum]